MSFSFPRAGAKEHGYVPEQVNAFIDKARDQFNSPESDFVTSDLVRNAHFDLVKGGYLIGAVDSALDRLEDTFATREIQRQLQTRGEYAVADRLARIQEILRGRIQRPKRKKFFKYRHPVAWLQPQASRCPMRVSSAAPRLRDSA